MDRRGDCLDVVEVIFRGFDVLRKVVEPKLAFDVQPPRKNLAISGQAQSMPETACHLRRLLRNSIDLDCHFLGNRLFSLLLAACLPVTRLAPAVHLPLVINRD